MQFGWNWIKSPPRGTTISRANSLARGLAGCWALNAGAGVPFDLVSRTPGVSNTAAWGATPYGTGLIFDGATQFANLGTSAAWSLTVPFSIAYLGSPAAGLGTTQNTIEFRSPTNAGGFSFNAQSTGTMTLTTASSGGTTSASSSAGAIDGGWHVYGVSHNSTSTGGVSFYKDGVPWGTATNTRNPAAYGTGRLGINPPQTSNYLSGSLVFIAIWSRGLTDADHAALAANPWVIFARRPIYVPGGATFSGQSSGGVVVGGLVFPAASFAPVPSGGAVLGGAASPATTFVATASGGPVAGGSAQGSSGGGTLAGESSGGAIAGGTAASSATFPGQSSGGIVAGGTAAPTTVFTAAASGGPVAGGLANATPVGGSTVGQSWGGVVAGGSANGTGSTADYGGIDVLAALHSWWEATSSVQDLASDGKLWQKMAPQGAVLPFVAFFVVHEMAETWTTSYPFMRSSVQINCCARTDVDARTMAIAVRKRLRADGGRLVIDGSKVMHCLPSQDGLQLGKEYGPDGSDCWIAFEVFDIAWTPES